jgi:hypothetical protein
MNEVPFCPLAANLETPAVAGTPILAIEFRGYLIEFKSKDRSEAASLRA